MKITRILGPIRSFVAKVMPWVVFVCLAVAMLFDPGRDTLGVASAAFAVALSLASVTFSYARTLKDGSAVRDELVFAGERLVSGAVMFLIASILKYASNDIPRYANTLLDALPRPDGGRPDAFGQNALGLPMAVVAFFLFLLGLIYAQMGITILVASASHRAKRRPDHEEYFASGKTVQERVAGLDQADTEVAASDNRVSVTHTPKL
jgi:Na+-transporting methylmalonyl-CoA/oxaloacetate decarboxylase gamma subunit